jgi:hypothetical protein
MDTISVGELLYRNVPDWAPKIPVMDGDYDVLIVDRILLRVYTLGMLIVTP